MDLFLCATCFFLPVSCGPGGDVGDSVSMVAEKSDNAIFMKK